MTSAFLASLTDPPLDFLLYLLEKGVLDKAQAQIVLTEKLQTQKSLETLCVDLGFVTAKVMRTLLADLKGLPEVCLSQMVLDVQVVRQVPQDVCTEACLIPLCIRGDEVWIAMADVENVPARDRLARIFGGKSLKIFLASAPEILEAITQYYGFEMRLEGLLREIEETGELPASSDSWVHPAVRFVNALLLDGVQRGASDIHCEPEKVFVRVRYRCDGILKTAFVFHKTHWPQVLVRLKIMAGMDISETRRPQNGRLTYHVMGREVDFRLAGHPTIHGENLVIRILDKGRAFLTLEELGYNPRICATLRRCLQKPEGLVVVTGPTGCGKTTSLYAFLELISSERVNVMTLEEPVEYQFPLVRQTDIREKIGLTFAEGIKSILRQDPDVLLVGEIRDSETAKMAVRAALTGHQVLTTLHTPDALGVVYRLLELGVAPTILAGHINCLLAQRLLRTLCPQCKKPGHLPQHLSSGASVLIFEAQGCEACEGTGYKGRMAIAELIVFDEVLNTWLLHDKDRSTALGLLRKRNYQTLWEDGLSRLFQGETSLAELERVLGDTPFSGEAL